MFSFRNTQRVAVMAQEVPTPFGELECLERYFSLRDLYNLSKTCTSWQRYAIKTFTGSYAARLVQVLEACSPELKAVLTERKLSTESTAVADPLMQLWTVVSHLQQGEAWQIALAAIPGAVHDIGRLSSGSHVWLLPESTAEKLFQILGLKINYEQLMSAAHNRSAGVEVWVKVQHTMHTPTDIPPFARIICCADIKQKHLDWWQAQSDKETAEMLQLALNCRHHVTAARVAAKSLPRINNIDVLLHLLQTAVIRQHVDVLELVSTSPAAEQLAPAAIKHLLGIAIDTVEQDLCQPKASRSIMQVLLTLPAASELDCQDILYLMQRAVARSFGAAITVLGNLPAAENMPQEDILDLLKLAIAQGSEAVVAALCELTIAKSVAITDWIELFQAAIERGFSNIAYQALCGLTAAREVTTTDVAVLLQLAVVCEKSHAAVKVLCDLPAADKVPIQLIYQLGEYVACRAAADPAYNATSIQRPLRRLEAVQDMCTTELLVLIGLISKHDCIDNSIISWLSELKAARQLPRDVVQQQIELAIQQQSVLKVKIFCQFSAAVWVDARFILKQASQAVLIENGSISTDIIDQLCRLQGAKDLDYNDLLGLLSGIVNCNHTIPASLSSLSAASEISTDDIILLLRSAVEHHNCSNVIQLCGLSRSNSLSDVTSVLSDLRLAALAGDMDGMSTILLRLEDMHSFQQHE